MKVYVAIVVGYDTHYILGVYSTRNKAKACCITWIHSEMRRYQEYYNNEKDELKEMWKEDIDILQRIIDTGDMDTYYGAIDTPRIEEWVVQ